MTGIEARDEMLRILERDLVGPRGGSTERITDRPADRYLTAALYPRPTDREDSLDEHDKDPVDQDASGPGEAVDLGNVHRPATMGLSVLIKGHDAILVVRGSAGRYSKETATGDWIREQIDLEMEIPVPLGIEAKKAADGLQWTIRPIDVQEGQLVSIMLTNVLQAAPGRDASEKDTFFQAEFSVSVRNGTIVPRNTRSHAEDPDAAANRLIYRAAREYATGHACSAMWREDERGIIAQTTWLPVQHVKGISAAGNPVFADESKRMTGDESGAFDAGALAEADPEKLRLLLSVIPDAYGSWLQAVEKLASELQTRSQLSPENVTQFRKHVKAGEATIERMRQGISSVFDDPTVMEAFQLAQRAMLQQSRWRKRNPTLRFQWRPFQLAFQLLVLPGLVKPQDENGSATEERQLVDLLWFPTGGGKTEAYLALVAFLLFLRRLRSPAGPDDGAGVAAFMRYTLRLLSSQQFERAARVVIACDTIRKTVGVHMLGAVPFSVGLWVGRDVTPNRLAECAKPEERKKAAQLAACPVCGSTSSLSAELRTNPDRFIMFCSEQDCGVHNQELPVWTVDDDIYRERPSLLIGTVDKFAQIVREKEIRSLFRVDEAPPDLIIQDELHLISGPLGSMTGLYEVAVERLCSKAGIGPKIIGSTATIRRAAEQVHALFNRRVEQFPAPVLDAEDSCFAVVDETRPGRIYVGVSSAGRSPKYLLQATAAVLLQGATELPDTTQARDPFWTLLLYFNSLRELGGALVMLLDDVEDSMKLLAKLDNNKQARVFDEEPMEMTSRTGSGDLPLQLKRLEEVYPQQAFGPVLATNMISVGVDVERLGLMVVNGQPKSMAEYIQATSRVGREQTPGLILTCYNAGRARDRSHFETFRTWHQALYREVEASSVTPFAPRARDRALHAPLVAMVRHTISPMNEKPLGADDHAAEIEQLIDLIVSRAASVDPGEKNAVLNELRAFVARWRQWEGLEHYWVDKKKQSLLISSERAADLTARNGSYKAAARPTPGSMRNVEPSCVLVLKEKL